MRHLILAATLGTVVIAGSALAQPAAPRFAEITARLEAQGYLIREMDRETGSDGGGYEVKATDREGRQVKLRLDATGQIQNRPEHTRREAP